MNWPWPGQAGPRFPNAMGMKRLTLIDDGAGINRKKGN